MIELEGEYTDARILGVDAVEERSLDQVQNLIDHEAFTESVRLMPDLHPGKGSVIGFTMPLGDRIVPNVIGVDIGCGMQAANLGSELPISGEELDEAIRARVPMGFGPDGLKAENRDYYHVKDDFPWHEVNETLEGFIEATEGEYVEEMERFRDSGGYDIEYFKELCAERAGRMSGYFNVKKGISSMGTLGSGNHFIEIGRSEKTNEYWVVVHSGSRGLGANTASYWQEQASRLRDKRADRARETLAEYPAEYLKFDPESVSDSDLLDWLHGGKGEDFVDYEALKAEFGERNPDRIEEIRGELKAAVPKGEPEGRSLDYLEGEEAAGYLIDMIFCQRYAAENRKMMARAVANVLGVGIADEIESTHNFIDFRDGIIRKGATRSHEGERVVVPFNMRDGTLIVEGKSNPEWNYSVAHGAGRLMSRTQAKKEFNEETVKKEMDGIQTSVIPLDEAPGAYKDAAMIERAIGETAEIIDRLEVVHNLKAP
jgi:tRNA-splicing ligase RtcB